MTTPDDVLPVPAPAADPIGEYDRLRSELQRLWAAPVRDMVAIDAVIARLDATHAAFKAMHGTRDHQRY